MDNQTRELLKKQFKLNVEILILAANDIASPNFDYASELMAINTEIKAKLAEPDTETDELCPNEQQEVADAISMLKRKGFYVSDDFVSNNAAAWVSPRAYGSQLTFVMPIKPSGIEDDDWYCYPLYRQIQKHKPMSFTDALKLVEDEFIRYEKEFPRYSKGFQGTPARNDIPARIASRLGDIGS